MSNQEKNEARAVRRRNRLIKKAVLWALILIGIGALVFFLVKSSNDNNGSSGGGEIPAVSSGEWIKWDVDSPVQLVEYSDFQCPACAQYHSLLKAVELEYGDKVAFVYRHYPIAQTHFNANAAAKASEAAGKQGKFWEMHDILFSSQALWASLGTDEAASVFAGYMNNFEGANVDQYLIDFATEEIQAQVTEDFAGAVRAGVNSTPTFYLNGKKIRNPGDIDGFRVLLDEALANSGNATE